MTKYFHLLNVFKSLMGCRQLVLVDTCALNSLDLLCLCSVRRMESFDCFNRGSVLIDCSKVRICLAVMDADMFVKKMFVVLGETGTKTMLALDCRYCSRKIL